MKNFVLLTVFILTIFSCSSESSNSDESNCTVTPSLSVAEVINVTESTATFNGQIIAPTCESTVTSQGFVYAKTTLPKTDDMVVEVAGEEVSFGISNLEPYTKYFVRTFFSNPTGDYYGEQVEFTTSIGDVEVLTKMVEAVKYNSALGGGNIVKDGGANVNTRGICWSTSQQPTLADFVQESGSGLGVFDAELNGLEPATTYYVRAFATNEIETIYGNEVSFTTPAYSKVYKGNLVLCTQQEVDEFGAKNYTHIEGSLEIGCSDNESSDIANLDALQGLVGVTNTVSFLYNGQLQNLNGLSNVKSIGSLFITNCDALTNLDAFSSLTELSYLSLNQNDGLLNLDGLANVSLASHLTIEGNVSLTNFCGLTILIKNNSYSGTYNVSGNGYNPTKQNIVDGACAK